jgi:hypothetical protein
VIQKKGFAIKIQKPDPAKGPVVVVNNALFSPSRDMVIPDAIAKGNVQIRIVSDELINPLNWNFFPSDDSQLKNAGTDLSIIKSMFDSSLYSLIVFDDFNNNPRNGDRTAGAYIWAESNSGWIIRGELKQLP